MNTGLFTKLFSGRTDVYGEGTYAMKAPLTKQIYEKHLRGEKRIGVYPLVNEKFTKWLAFDIDKPDFSIALQLKKKCAHYKLNINIERSKSKGHHLWLFFDKLVEAKKARLVAKHILDELDMKSTELFPKQDLTTEDRPLGNFIYLPLNAASVEENRTIFIDDNEKSIITKPEELDKIKLTPIDILDDIIEMNDLHEEEFVVNQETEIITFSKTLPCIENIKSTPLKEHDGRNECGFRLAIFYKQKGLGKDDIYLILHNWDLRNIDKLGKRELITILDSVFRGNYKSYGCDSAIIKPFCDKANCPIVLAKDRKARIDAGIITLVFRDDKIMVFKKLNLEYRLANIEASKKGEIKSTVTLSRDEKIVFKDVISFDKALHRKRFVSAADDGSINDDLIKIEDLCKKKIEDEVKEEKDKKPRQLYIMTEEEKREALAFLEKTPNLLYEIIKTTDGMGITGEENLRLLIYMVFTSRICEKPLSLSVKGESSSGKSFLCEKVMKLIPEEGYFFMSQATKQAFFHLPEDALQHRIVFIAEQTGTESADYSIRTAQSEGELVLLMPVKDPVTGDMETKEKRVKGPVGFMMTTTKAMLFSENETRNFSIYTDDSPQLTKKVHKITARKAKGEDFEVSPEVLNKLKNFQRLLSADFKVIIPFAHELFDAFPDKPVRIRRDGEKFRILIEIIALLHQFQRKQIKTNGKIILEATVADYYLARKIADTTLLHTIYEIGPPSQAIWNMICELKRQFYRGSPEESSTGESSTEEFNFKYKDIMDAFSWKYEKTKKWVRTLLTANYIEFAESSKGKKATVYKINELKENKTVLEATFLPSLEQLFKKYPCPEKLFYEPFSGISIDPKVIDMPMMMTN